MNWYKYAQISIQEAVGLFNLPNDFNIKDLTSAYRRLIKEWHPDINKSPQALEMSKKINASYSLLRRHLENFNYNNYENMHEDIDVPPPFNQKRNISEAEVFSYVVNNIKDYLEDVIYGPVYHAYEPEEVRQWPAKIWFNQEVFLQFIQKLLLLWEKTYSKKLSNNFKADFIDYAILLYETESFSRIVLLLNRYIFKNYETKNIIERIRDIW